MMSCDQHGNAFCRCVESVGDGEADLRRFRRLQGPMVRPVSVVEE